VKLWLDAQLPPAIAGWIASAFGVECEHIRGTPLAGADDPGL
jgi:predicted nuclease of predicted toxin-antitoxin system